MMETFQKDNSLKGLYIFAPSAPKKFAEESWHEGRGTGKTYY